MRIVEIACTTNRRLRIPFLILTISNSKLNDHNYKLYLCPFLTNIRIYYFFYRVNGLYTSVLTNCQRYFSFFLK